MKKIFRALAWIFVLLAGWRLYGDISATMSQNRDFRMRLAGEVWAAFDRNSLLGLQPAVERYISPRLWEWVFLPILDTPLFPMLVLAAIFFFIASVKQFKLR